jgi:hypothetical protein
MAFRYSLAGLQAGRLKMGTALRLKGLQAGMRVCWRSSFSCLTILTTAC